MESLKTKAMKALNILKCVSNTKYGGDRTSLLRLYRSLVRSKLDYGCFIYWTASDNVIKKLDPVHTTALRIATGAFRSSPVTSLYAESGEPPLQIRRNQLALQYYTRSMHIPNSPIYDSIFNHQCISQRADTDTFADKVRVLCGTHSLLDVHVFEVSCLHDPVWLLPRVTCEHFQPPNKSNISQSQMKQLFLEHLDEYHSTTSWIHTDGSKTESGVAGAILHNDYIYSRKMNADSSIFTAELRALLSATTLIKNSTEHSNFTIFTDSLSAKSAIVSFNNSHPIICKILHQLIKIHKQGKIVEICWVPSHVGIRGNEAVNEAAREAALGDDNIENPKVHYRDYSQKIKTETRNRWQEEWESIEGNKLRMIKPSASVWTSSNQKSRQIEVILARLRIGHTRSTHHYLMERGTAPFCHDCIVPLTVLHIIAECPSWLEQRTRHFPNTSGMSYNEIMNHVLSENDGKYNIAPLISYLNDLSIMNEL